MLDREENFELLLLEISKLKQLKKIRNLENTMRDLYEIEQELNSKLKKVEFFQEKALIQITNELKTLEKIESDINRLKERTNKIFDETIIKIKLTLQFPFKNTCKRWED